MALGGSLSLGIVLTASDLASGTIKSVAKSFAGLDDAASKMQEKFASKLGKGLFGGLGMEPTLGILKDLGKASGVAALGLAGLAAAFKLADSTAEFELRLAELGATTKLTASQVDDFEKRAMNLGLSGTAGPLKIADAFRELAASTLTGDQALKALKPTLDILAGSFGRLSPEQAGGLVAKTLEAFPDLANDATRAVDLLARAFKGGLKPEELAHAMEKAAKGEKFLGSSLEEVLTTLGGAKGAGLSVSRLSAEMLRNVGYTEKFQSAQERMRRALGDTSVSAEKNAEKFASSWEGLKDSVTAAVDVLGDQIGKPLREVFEPVFKVVVGGIRSVVTWITNLSPAVKKTAAQFFVFGSLALVIGGLKMAIAAIIPVVGAVLAALAPVIVTGALIAAGAYLIYKAWESNFGGLRDVVLNVFNSIKLAVLSLVQLFTEGEISGALADELLKTENGPIYDFVEGVSRLAANVKNAWREVGPDILKMFQILKTDLAPIFGGILSIVASVLKAAGGLIVTVIGILSGNMSTIMRGLAIMVNAGIDMINTLIDKAGGPLAALLPGFNADDLKGMKLQKVTAQQVAFGLGADETAALLAAEDQARRAAVDSGGPPSSSSQTGTTSGVPSSVASTTLPASRPAGSAVAAAPEANGPLITAIEGLGKRTVVVNGILMLDGSKIADWQAKEDRDRAAAAGTTYKPFRAYGHDAE